MNADEVWLLLRQGLTAESAEQATDCFYRALGTDANSAAAQKGMEWALRWLTEGHRPPLPEELAPFSRPIAGLPPSTVEAILREPIATMSPEAAATMPEAIPHRADIQAPRPEAPPSLGALAAEVAPPLAEAVPEVLEAPPIVSPSPDLLLQQGLEELKAERFAEAAESLRQVLSIQPDLAEAHENLGLALYYSGSKQDALEEYRAWARLIPDHGEAFANQGFILEELGRYEEAVEAFRRALTLAPALAEAQMGLAESLQALERWPEAAAAWEGAISRRPDLPAFRASLAEVYIAQGRPNDAASALQQAARQQPNDAAMGLKLGQTLLAARRFEEAVQQFQTLLGIDPDLKEAKECLERAQAAASVGHNASLIRRFIAFVVIDLPLAFVLPYLVYIDLIVAGGGTVFSKMPLTDPGVLLALALYLWSVVATRLLIPLVVPLVYFTFGHGLRGQTIGKRLLGIRVVRADGHPPGLIAALLRTVVMFVLSPALVTWWPVPFTRRALHDYAAGTRVVRASRARGS